MDIDPKPANQSPTPDKEPTASDPTQSFAANLHDNNPTTTSFADALDEGTATESNPIVQPVSQPAPLVTESTVEPVAANNPFTQKKSRKGLVIGIIIIVILLAAAGVAWYMFAGPGATKTTTSTSTASESKVEATTPATAGTAIDSAANAVTTGAVDEASSAATDDSNTATDASTSAANVGDSIDASSF
jgi:hypothetical protein